MTEEWTERICGEYRIRRVENRAEILKYLGPAPQKVQSIDAGRQVSVPQQLDGLPVAVIGPGAFRDTGVTQVTLPEGLLRIGARAFSFCRFLREIRLPDSLLEMEREAFRGCSGLKTFLIPKHIREIPPRAFDDCRELVSAVLPEGLEAIGTDAFRNCFCLEKILPGEFPALREIGAGAFHCCTALREFRLGSGVGSVGGKAFRNCPQLLLTVTAGTAAEAWCAENKLRYQTVGGDGKVLSLFVPPPREVYETEETGEGTCRILRCVSESGRITVPEQIGGKTVTGIGPEAFTGVRKARSLVLPDTVKSIGKAAFRGTRFHEVTVGKNLEEIGDEAFSECMRLNCVRGFTPALRRIGTGAFRGCRYLRSVEFSKAETLEIGKDSFCGCEWLQSVVIPESGLTVGSGAFRYCQHLTEVSLPSGTKEIGDRAFAGCIELNRITVPSRTVTVGAGVFAQCVRLREIRLPEDHERLSVTDGVLTDRAEHRAVAYCAGNGETRCVIPRGTETVGKEAFASAKLERVILPEGVKVLETGAFENCRNLRAVRLPGSLRVIGEQAFYHCDQLSWIVIPEGVEKIGSWAFAFCYGMGRLRLPAGIKKMEGHPLGWGNRLPFLIVPEGSYAEQYCREQGYRFEVE